MKRDNLSIEVSDITILNLNRLRMILQSEKDVEADYDTMILYMLYKTLGEKYFIYR